MNEPILRFVLVALLVFLINIPFGVLRGKQKRFSFKWFLYIHLPIPFVIMLRIFSDVGFSFYTYPVLISVFFMGQFIGRKYVLAVCPFQNRIND
jgi:hypothetical protein